MGWTAKVYLAGAGPGDPDLLTRLEAGEEVRCRTRLLELQHAEARA